jgi:hypothetical protein
MSIAAEPATATRLVSTATTEMRKPVAPNVEPGLNPIPPEEQDECAGDDVDNVVSREDADPHVEKPLRPTTFCVPRGTRQIDREEPLFGACFSPLPLRPIGLPARLFGDFGAKPGGRKWGYSSGRKSYKMLGPCLVGPPWIPRDRSKNSPAVTR